MSGAFTPTSAVELQQLLQSRPGRVRLVGSGTRQQRLPEPAAAAQVHLSRLDAIVRLDGPDQTCTVETGVTRQALDAALAPLGLELPCPGGGTIGGLFASDPIGAAAAGGQSPRTLLLGSEGLLADGTPFRSGAQVVKSVAGFDVHKLLVGSEGRLFVVTRLHLRLKPRPRATAWFTRTGLEPLAACALLSQLRQQTLPPSALQLHRGSDGACTVHGCLAGRPAFVQANLRELGLQESAAAWLDHLPGAGPGAGSEVLAGQILPSALPQLLELRPGAPVLWHGGGRFELATPDPTTTDAVLAALPRLVANATIVHGAPARRGCGTPIDPGQRLLAERLRSALDPHGILV
jgi:glycolate oxidase FAD binding subunit